MGSTIPPFKDWASDHGTHDSNRPLSTPYADQYTSASRLPPPERLVTGTSSNVTPFEFQSGGYRPSGRPSTSIHPYTPRAFQGTGLGQQTPSPLGHQNESIVGQSQDYYPSSNRGTAMLPPPPTARQESDIESRTARLTLDSMVPQQYFRPGQDAQFSPNPSPTSYTRQSDAYPYASSSPLDSFPPKPVVADAQNRWPVIRSNPLQIPNLLGEERESVLSDVSFRLRLRQQPKAARSCGFGERDRRVIDPPPIVELVIESTRLSEAEVRKYRCYDSYVMSCSILDETGTRDASYMPEEYRHQRRLMGSLVGTPFVGKDEFGKEGCFFIFSDLSCRTPGAYRLKFSVIMIDPRQAGKKKHFPILTDARSEVFNVYNAKDFPGMAASSELAHSLKAQGCLLQLKKGIDRTRGGRAMDDDSDYGNDYDDDDVDRDYERTSHRRKRRSIRN